MTQIFKDYSEFLNRKDKTINGVSPSFATNNPKYEEQNTTNEGCWNCRDCSYCRDCSDCSGCSGCSDCRDCRDCSYCSYCRDCSGCIYCSEKQGLKNGTDKTMIDPRTVKIENIHQKVLEAIQDNGNILDMGSWHKCDTTHCRGGWVTHLAGKDGAEIEKRFGMPLAAHIIYKNSSTIPVRWNQYYLNNKEAMEDIERCAREEAAMAIK